MSAAYGLLRPFLFNIEAETAHGMTLRALTAGLYPRAPAPDRRLAQRLMGLDFPNPVGLAAGFDKNAEVPDAALGLGFGFAEVGTVTPRPQAGNPRPRVFRLPADRAVVNRLGFNNEGYEAAARRLAARRRRNGIVGVNIGANRDATDRVAAYVEGIARFATLADYVVINVSSPNTPGLRDLQEKTALASLLGAAAEARRAAAKPVPLLVKLAPDLDVASLAAIAETAGAHGIDGIILSNTTISRDGATDPRKSETGGMSGRPLFERSTALIARLRQLCGNEMVLVGVGGIDSTDTAWTKLAAGANLVQLYTGMVYEGPTLPARIVSGLAKRLDREGIARIGDIVGRETDAWAKRA